MLVGSPGDRRLLSDSAPFQRLGGPDSGSYGTLSPKCQGEITAQVKILASDETVEKFKRIVLAKHGKLELSAEGEEALKLYVKKYEKLLGGMVPPDEDPHRFKPMHFPLAGMRRVHFGNFVLFFSVDEQRKTVIHEDYEHRDTVYRA